MKIPQTPPNSKLFKVIDGKLCFLFCADGWVPVENLVDSKDGEYWCAVISACAADEWLNEWERNEDQECPIDYREGGKNIVWHLWNDQWDQNAADSCTAIENWRQWGKRR